MKTLSRNEALALADRLESELRSDDPALRKTVTLRFLDDSAMRIESSFVHKEGKWIIVLSEHHRALVYDDEEVEFSEKRYPTKEETEARNEEARRAAEILGVTESDAPEVSEKDCCVPLDFRESFYWIIHAKKEQREGEKEPVIRLSWGWTAGMSDEEKAYIAEDSPKGEEYVYLSRELAIDLRDKLDNLLKD